MGPEQSPPPSQPRTVSVTPEFLAHIAEALENLLAYYMDPNTPYVDEEERRVTDQATDALKSLRVLLPKQPG